ncbi:MAG TPA: carboxypeptidase regulatory-like domain-containing protein [Myxococcota bacterium]|nr:carboxypeptidase regulatory-like domain-containing protein [Myxococcota bacterium]
MHRIAAIALVGAACLLGAPGARAGETGELRGAVSLGVAGIPLAAVAPVVVYLESLAAPSAGAPAPRTVARMRQHDARFSPPFLVVAAGQSVEMANDDAIYHNVFSYSRPNDFDLGLYPAGESRTLVLKHPGVVKLYCSIHESMNATILVAPTRWFDVVDAKGGYVLPGVPPGRYRAVVWTERLPAVERVVEIGAGAPRTVDWVIGAPG